ncbi:PorP/SprF family type IX secretion system membrane protein [Salinimicrobium flavum]|uniref:Type IX secretion system membrane protein PorP/SprF n=1 Tax=Salinimicrobium flavum TaxID=1737065 RepID=A0ABW5IWL6_9FLAO
MRFLMTVMLVLSLLYSPGLRAQEVSPTYSDYLTDNLYLLHPSMAGASNRNKIRLTARRQWLDMKNAPGFETLSLHARVKENIGLGGIIFNDHNGNYSRRGTFGTFAYHLRFSIDDLDLNQLSFGLSGGLIQHSLDQSGFTGPDPLIGEGRAADIYGNIDVGASYYYMNFFAHFSAKNILSVKRDLFFSDAVPANQRKFIFSGGYVIETFRRYWSYEPSLLFQWKEAANEKLVDLNLKVYRSLESGSLYGGISYRRTLDATTDTAYENLNYLTPFLGLEYNNLLFAYTYSQQINETVISNGGFHQITLGYNFGKNRGRYDCYCPGVNQTRRR